MVKMQVNADKDDFGPSEVESNLSEDEGEIFDGSNEFDQDDGNTTNVPDNGELRSS